MPKHTSFQHDAIAFSPTGKAIAIGSSQLTGNMWKGELALYADSSAAGERKKASAKASTETGCPTVAWLSERRLITGCDTGAINVWDWRGDGGVELLDTKLEHDDVVRSVTVNHDMSKALSASDDSTLRVWDMLDASSTASISCLQGHAAPVLAGAWADAGSQTVASISKDCTVCLWDIRKTATPATVGMLGTSYATSVAWSASHPNQLILGHVTGEVAAYDVRSLGTATKLHTVQKDVVGVLAINKDGLVASGSDDGTVAVYSLESSDVIYTDGGKHGDFVRGLSWDPSNPQCLKSASWDGKVVTHSF